ncbi:MAG: CoA transferase [Betaproteobacteria bacterium]|nr:CoA transferase [Betaproteobacteria bacterium]
MDAETRNGPLAGYRVLEMGSTIAGPFCGRLLADFGAEVIKVEPAEGDAVRLAGKRFKGKSLYAASIFRNKTLISVDLRRPRGQEVIKRLVPHCDIVVENFRPGGLEKWGLGYSDLARIKPDIIMVRISGYGQSGPYSPRPGYGVICEAVSGLRHLTGDPDRPPARVAIALTDYITGVYAAFGAILALLHRNRTGVGQYVDAALAECAFSFLEPHVPAYDKLGVVANRMGSALANSVPNNLYPTRDGRYIHIQAAQNPVFKRLAAAMGMPELLEDERFATALGRQQHPQETDGIVERWTSSHALAEIESKLKTAEVPAAGINTLEDIFRDPHFRARGMLVEAPDGELGTVTLAGPVPKLSATPAQIRRSGGSIGQDTRRVLTGLAGYAETDLKQLEAQGIVYCDPKS